MFFETTNRYIYIKKENSLDTGQHLHNPTEIFICTEGAVEVMCKDQERVLTAGNLMIAFPYDIHGYINSHKGKGFLLIFNSDISPEIKRYNYNGKYTNFLHSNDIIPFFEQLCKEYNEEGSSTIMLGYLHLIMGYLFKKLPTQNSEVSPESDLLTKALIYISGNYTQRLTLSGLAKHMGVSQNHLSRVISKKIPAGFCRYLQQLRIHHACDLLKNTDKTIYEILLESGFTNPQTFYRVFKSETELSPKEYRKTHQALI